MQLDAADGRWTVRRNGDHIRDISGRRWKNAAYLAIRVNQMGWGVPAGIADPTRRPLE